MTDALTLDVLPNGAARLDDRYVLESGRAFMNGTQALVRLAIAQARRDRAAGLHTAGYVTGYRGSPLGGVDSAFRAAAAVLDPLDVRIRPAVNEELAATAAIGTQQVGLYGPAKTDGVFALWYGKGPGVDRSGDALAHGNRYGTSPHGGVLVLAGDDHMAKSSTTAHQSEYALVHAMIPVLHPATLDEVVGFGLLGWAMSRATGLWASLKLVTDLVDSAGVVALDAPPPVVLPEGMAPSDAVRIRAPDVFLEQERRIHEVKLPAALLFAAANGIDRVSLRAPAPRLGIVATGKSWRDTRAALRLLGLDDAAAAALGVSIYKVGMTWPLEPAGARAFAQAQREVLVVEEKRPLVEDQLKALLFNLPEGRRPQVWGKADGENARLLPSFGDLTPVDIARAIGARLLPHVEDAGLIARIAALSDVDPAKLAALAPVRRTPYFCSGCPHNTSTRVPEGSRAFAGIGCHGMAQNMDRATDTFVQMGGEGANWIGQAPYVEAAHVFQNLGDGTFFHSGVLALRAAVAAGVNITYKILVNDAVAMTGGQPVDGAASPQTIAAQVRAEGVSRIAVVSDDTDKYVGQPPFPSGATIHPRRDLDAVQRELRDTTGVTVIVYDQVCATEKRRRRKRDLMPAADRRVIINDLVCEGCGDCSAKSNCLSVIPLETPLGRKRQIDQSSCNQDLSCLEGFCPSFATAHGGKLRRPAPPSLDALGGEPPPPPAPVREDAAILITGVGGTGVVTIGAVLAMAAHLAGKAGATLDMTGLAQKGGQVTTHLRIAASPEAIDTVKLGPGEADLVVGADLVSSAGPEALSVLRRGGGARVLLNGEETVTGAFIAQPDFRVPGARLRSLVEGIAGRQAVTVVDATALARRWLGDAIGANMLLVGHAWQSGAIPLPEAAILRAITLNGTSAEMNRQAFRLGRLLAARPDAAAWSVDAPPDEDTLEIAISRRVDFLSSYQDARYAAAYRAFVDKVRAAEREAVGAEGELTLAAARGLFKLMAYKDEYEVARLWTGDAFARQLDALYEEPPYLEHHLAPPLLARRDPHSGEPRKLRFGPWMRTAFRLLAPLKRLRGTPFDPFGHTAERRTERALIGRYRARVELACLDLSAPGAHARAVEVARLAERIRGYGHVKLRNLAEVEREWARLELAGGAPPAARPQAGSAAGVNALNASSV